MPGSNRPPVVKPGEKYGRLTVIQFSHTDKRWRRHFIVRCDCGNEKTVQGTLLKSGNTKSCGCLAREVRRARRVSLHHSSITAIILGYKRHARERGYEWFLTRAEVTDVIQRPCYYCGSPPSNTMLTKNSIEPYIYNGIDRIDNHKGYSLDNVVTCCRICNNAKNDMTVYEFHSWVMHIAAMAEQWGNLKEVNQ